MSKAINHALLPFGDSLNMWFINFLIAKDTFLKFSRSVLISDT